MLLNETIENSQFPPSMKYRAVLGEKAPEAVLLGGGRLANSGAATLESSIFDGQRERHPGLVRFLPNLKQRPGAAGPGWP
jgi:hypothetical protein